MRTTKLLTLVLIVCSTWLPGCQKSSPKVEPRENPVAPVAHDHSQHEHDHSQHEHDHSQHMMPAATPLADRSIYHLQADLTDQNGKDFNLSSLRGTAVLAAMFYASCTSVCPMLISQIKHIEDTIPADIRQHTQVLLVSLDPARDTVDKLKQLAQQHAVTDPRWHFLRTQPDSVRELAALLGIRYRQLPGGDIVHSPVLALLDQDGVITARMENAAEDPAALVSALTQTVQRDVALAH